jgi:hypothetical protein
MDRKGGHGKRIIKIPWESVDAAIYELFPGARFGYPYNAAMPGFPWLRCQSVDIAPFDPGNPRLSANGITSYYPTGALLTINYAPNEWDDNDDSPGSPENTTFVEHRTSYSGEFLTWPGQGVRWAVGTDGTAIEGSGSGDKRYGVNEDIKVGILIPIIEHETTWNFVRQPNWGAVRRCLGRVNKATYMGAYPETLLFLGASASRTFSTTGYPWWKLTYKFQEKCYNFDEVKKPEQAQGWNHFLRPNGANTKFERMIRGNGDPIYGIVQMRQLFGGAA